MEGFQKNIYLLTEEETKSALTLSEIAQLRKGQRFQKGVTFSQDMTDYDVRNLLESLFPDILPNKRFSCATRDGQSSSQFNFHGEHRVWDGRTIKRKVKGQSAMYLVLKDVVEDKLVFNPVLPARGTPSSLQGHSLSTSFCHNSKNSQTVSLTQTPQSATTVTSMNTTNSTENAEKTTQWEQDLSTNNLGWLDDILSSLHPSDIGFENLLPPIGFGAVEASSLTNGSQEHNQGGGLFQAEIEEELPPSVKTGWAIFGKRSVKVRVSRDGLALSGKGIPRGDAPGLVTVTKRAFDEFDESLKRLKREFGVCDDSDECTAEGSHETGVTQVVKAQLAEEGYLGDTETSDKEDEDSDLMDNNENETEEGCSFVSLDPLYSLTESDIHDRQLPEGVGARWKDLARKLGFKECSIEVIEKENCTCHDRCIKLLVRWMEKAGQHGATAGKLAAALKAIELQSLADRLIGPSDRRMIMMEIQGTLHLEDRNGTEIIMGVDSTERRTFFMWKSLDREFKTSVKKLKSYFDATCQISAQTPEVIEKIIGTSVRTSADVKSREDSPSTEQISTQMPQVMEEDIAKLIEDKDRKDISTQTPDTLEEINGTSAERSQWREDSSIKVHISTQTNETDEVFRKSDETKGEDSPAKEQIGVQIPEVMKEIIRRSSEDRGQKEISTQKPDTSEEFIGTPAEKWMEDSPIKVQIRTQNPVVGEEYRPSDKTNMEDSCKKVLMSTPPSEGEVKIIGTSAEFQREGSYHQEPIATQTSEVEKEIIGTSDEDKGLEDSFVAIQVCTQTFEVVEEVIRTPAEEMEQFSTQASEGVEENIKTGEEKVENSISKGPKISEKLKDLQEKLSVVEKNLKIPELKEEAFHVTKKLDLISRHNTTIQELYTRVTGMVWEANKCDEFLREKFYDFSHRSLRAVHNNLNKSFADLQLEQGKMKAAEKRKLDSLILSRNGREKQIMYLDKILKRQFSSADEIKKSQSSPRGRGNRKISGDSKIRLRKRKTQSRVLSP